MKLNKIFLIALVALPITLLVLSNRSKTIQTEEVNIYTSRHYDADNMLYEQFTDQTGIKVNIISAWKK